MRSKFCPVHTNKMYLHPYIFGIYWIYKGSDFCTDRKSCPLWKAERIVLHLNLRTMEEGTAEALGCSQGGSKGFVTLNVFRNRISALWINR